MSNKPFVEWTDALSVGIEEIDAQHKVLVQLINRLYDETIITQADNKVLNDILHDLIEYTIVHFSVEESLFRIFDYPAIEIHIKHHTELRDQVRDIQKKILTGEAAVNSKLLVFLKNWLQHHIMEEDKQYAPFLLEQGVRGKSPKSSWLGRLFHK